jgi:thiol-disulfide isomerase/thioredoxin
MLRLFVLGLCVFGAVCEASTDDGTQNDGVLPQVDVAGMKNMIMTRDKAVLLMFATGCTRAKEFAPVLAKVARNISGLSFGMIDVISDKTVAAAAAKGVQVGAPALKAFFRNAPPSRRVLEYAGPPHYIAVLEWARAVHAWDGSDELPSGWEVGATSQGSGSASSSKRTATKREGSHIAKAEL